MKIFMLILISVASISWNNATYQTAKTNTITFMTTAICEDCKERIEEKLNYTKGVIFTELDLNTKMLTVKYKTELITDLKIKEILASIGYSSDTVVRNREAYLALPKCCQGSESCVPQK